ncbi:MAG: GMC family oxidoreductase, partial [Gemmatimonadetes bacterium]|nr:GMC family oxidoreductase [Gemmatimonadota bacterium]NIR79610.1 GMC family oxidoreductase [Gemmatimonadota bacterium]NIT88291.1 GMC family oxidoreductase [Gemmatimonadota bacterium]NIU32105.1 GMC family oxidoreductase [Gemmatimonadota bacterium]NIU36700.1 GMC family oxidoreductase [Gemmatimonadota bacterium]
MPRTVEADLCIVGGGITAAMVAEKVAEGREARIVVLEAGDRSAPLERRSRLRRRYLDYGESPWPRDHIRDQSAEGIISRSMVLGGQALHWGGTTPRFSPEDFRLRSLFGVAVDWPLTYEELDPFYQEAEERIGVAGEQGPPELDPRGAPYPMSAM